MKSIKKLTALVLALTLVLGMGVTAQAAEGDKPILALGADLSADQRATVLGLLGISESDLGDYDVISITNVEEHQYLDSYLSSSVIGTHALSSVLIRPADEGEGLNVTTYNISYCTIDMYTNALLTAGLQDLGTSLGDSETASDMVAYIKQQILENNVSSDADIEKIIRDAMEKFDIKLSDDQIQQLIDLMHKISKLDIDVDALAKQAGEIYNKLKDMGLDLSKVDTKQVGNFITRFFDRIMSLVNQFIG